MSSVAVGGAGSGRPEYAGKLLLGTGSPAIITAETPDGGGHGMPPGYSHRTRPPGRLARWTRRNGGDATGPGSCHRGCRSEASKPREESSWPDPKTTRRKSLSQPRRHPHRRQTLPDMTNRLRNQHPLRLPLRSPPPTCRGRRRRGCPDASARLPRRRAAASRLQSSSCRRSDLRQLGSPLGRVLVIIAGVILLVAGVVRTSPSSRPFRQSTSRSPMMPSRSAGDKVEGPFTAVPAGPDDREAREEPRPVAEDVRRAPAGRPEPQHRDDGVVPASEPVHLRGRVRGGRPGGRPWDRLRPARMGGPQTGSHGGPFPTVGVCCSFG